MLGVPGGAWLSHFTWRENRGSGQSWGVNHTRGSAEFTRGRCDRDPGHRDCPTGSWGSTELSTWHEGWSTKQGGSGQLTGRLIGIQGGTGKVASMSKRWHGAMSWGKSPRRSGTPTWGRVEGHVWREALRGWQSLLPGQNVPSFTLQPPGPVCLLSGGGGRGGVRGVATSRCCCTPTRGRELLTTTLEGGRDVGGNTGWGQMVTCGSETTEPCYKQAGEKNNHSPFR